MRATRGFGASCARPPMVIRAPEGKDDGGDLYMTTNMPTATKKRTVRPAAKRAPALNNNKPDATVYVARYPKCLYSEELVELAYELGVVLDINDIGQVPPPAWVPGTPTIATLKDAFCGDAAFEWVQCAARLKSKPTRQDEEEYEGEQDVGGDIGVDAEDDAYSFLAPATDAKCVGCPLGEAVDVSAQLADMADMANTNMNQFSAASRESAFDAMMSSREKDKKPARK